VFKILHEEYHVPNIVISSIPLKQWLLEALPQQLRPSSVSGEDDPSHLDTDFLLCISSSATIHMTSPSVVHAQSVPLIPGYYSGVGDLFSALLLGHYHTDFLDDRETPLSHATSQALTKTHAILYQTHRYAESLPEQDRLPTDDEKDASDPLRRIRRMKGRELRLIQNQDILRNTARDNVRHLEPWIGFW
jgi:pyridoxine kinase